MSIRREVVSLSQLLRRNENSRSSRGSGRAPPLPLQTSRRKAEATLSAGLTTVETRKAQSTSFPESLSKSGHQPVTFTQRVLDASRELTPQPEFRAGIQRNKDYQALSQEVYEAESEQLSAMTSMSQSSFSQPQSQNLLGPSHDDQLYRLQQWQTQQTLPTHKSPTRCNGIEKLQEIESNLIKAFIGQTRDQKHQQTELLTQFASPIKKSIVEVKAKLESTFESQQQQLETIGGHIMTHLKGLDIKGACEKTRMSVQNDTAAVKAALSDLQAKVKIVEGGVKSCSGLVAQVIEAKSTSHNAILAALTNSSCIVKYWLEAALILQLVGHLTTKGLNYTKTVIETGTVPTLMRWITKALLPSFNVLKDFALNVDKIGTINKAKCTETQHQGKSCYHIN